MNRHRYDSFEKQELIFRDQLAIDRTVLANDRTALAFARTALTLLVVGVSVFHFLEGAWWDIVATLVCLTAVIVLILGIMRYRRIHLELMRIGKSGERPILEEGD